MTTLSLGKYEALGNDFLVLLDPSGSARFDETLVAALCDRHRGIGADGVIRLSAGGDGAVVMTLRNADGGIAETSGNGLRCAALAARDGGLVEADEFTIETLAGVSSAVVEPGTRGRATVRVTMGTVRVREETPSPHEGFRAFRVDVGNPHLVLLGGALDAIDLAALGPVLEAATPGGVNVEVVAPRDDGLELVVWERGVGLTLACGSGSCAAAAAAHAVGLVGPVVTVQNPGGTLVVGLDGGDPTAPVATLVGPARRVGRVLVELEELFEGEAARP